MDCKFHQAHIEAYLDGELERRDARELEAHLDGCAECRAALDRLDALRRQLRGTGLRYAAPDSLRARIAAQPIAAAPRRRPAWLRMAAAWLLAFGAGATSVYMWNSAQDGGRANLAHDAFAGHWRALAAASPVDVVSSDRHTVKPWFAGKVAQAPAVTDFADQGFPLLGGRIDYLGGSRVPVLVYRHGQHLIDVFVLPEGTPMGSGASANGYRCEPARVGSAPAAVVSDMDETEFSKFEGLLASVAG